MKKILILLIISLFFLNSCAKEKKGVSPEVVLLNTLLSFKSDDLMDSLKYEGIEVESWATMVVNEQEDFKEGTIIKSTSIYVNRLHESSTAYGYFKKEEIKDYGLLEKSKRKSESEVIFNILFKYENGIFYDQDGNVIEELRDFKFYSESVDLAKNTKLVKRKKENYDGTYKELNNGTLDYLQKYNDVFKISLDLNKIKLGNLAVNYSDEGYVFSKNISVDEASKKSRLSFKASLDLKGNTEGISEWENKYKK